MSKEVEIPLVTILYACNTHKELLKNYKESGIFMPIELKDIVRAMTVNTEEVAVGAVEGAKEKGYIDEDNQMTDKGYEFFGSMV